MGKFLKRAKFSFGATSKQAKFGAKQSIVTNTKARHKDVSNGGGLLHNYNLSIRNSVDYVSNIPYHPRTSRMPPRFQPYAAPWDAVVQRSFQIGWKAEKGGIKPTINIMDRIEWIVMGCILQHTATDNVMIWYLGMSENGVYIFEDRKWWSTIRPGVS